MADYITIFAALILVAAFLALGMFVFRLGVMERRAMFGEQPRSLFDIPAQTVVEVRNPFVLRLQEANWQKGDFFFSNVKLNYDEFIVSLSLFRVLFFV